VASLVSRIDLSKISGAALDQTPAACAFSLRNFEGSAGRTSNLAGGFVAATRPQIGKVRLTRPTKGPYSLAAA
jgi:hypothetical protein